MIAAGQRAERRGDFRATTSPANLRRELPLQWMSLSATGLDSWTSGGMCLFGYRKAF
jgi:hypothetical protein